MKKLKWDFYAKVVKMGHSHYVIIPILLAQLLKMKKGTEVKISYAEQERAIRIRPLG